MIIINLDQTWTKNRTYKTLYDRYVRRLDPTWTVTLNRGVLVQHFEMASASPINVSIAAQPNDVNAVAGLVKELQAGVDGLTAGGDAARHDLLIKARTLMQALETPRETMVKHCWGQVSNQKYCCHEM